MDDSNYGDSDAAYGYERRLEAEWTAVSALREVAGIALKGRVQPTYLQTLALAQHLMPWLFDPEQSLLFRQQESPTTRQYREMADAQSELDGKRVTALELVERDIRRYELLAEVGPERYEIRRVLHLLYRARKELQPRPYTEQQLILRDVFKVDRRLPVSDDGRDYREFELPNDRRLRLRILHPDPPEHSTGADVIYEHYWDEKRMVRLAAIQYKV